MHMQNLEILEKESDMYIFHSCQQFGNEIKVGITSPYKVVKGL